jgi:Dolichyl-phosphate-mannose-protein mannosyltransferase
MKINDFATYTCLALITVLALAAFAFCFYRAFLPLEIDPNEAWNAWHSRAIGINHLYPAPDELITNNYPPIYFYIIHGLALLGLEPIYTGRIISILAVVILSLVVYRGVIILGQNRLAACAGAIWFAATFAAGFTGYVGMNDPHLPALAAMCSGFVWFMARERRGQAAEPAILVMALAGFIKHNIIAIPASALLWLAFKNWRKAARAAAFGAAVCAIGLLICYAAYGGDFIAQLLLPREMTLKNAYLRLPSAQPLLPGAMIATLWLLLAGSGNPLRARIATLLLLTFASGFIQIFGEGVDVNAYFEFLFALGLGAGIAFGEAPNIAAGIGVSAGMLQSAFAALLLLGTSASFPAEPYKLISSDAFRAELAEAIDAVKSEVKRIRAIRGNVSCSVTIVCYWAGKAFVWDAFALAQRVATGQWSQQQLDRRAREARIRFENIDDRTNW